MCFLFFFVFSLLTSKNNTITLNVEVLWNLILFCPLRFGKFYYFRVEIIRMKKLFLPIIALAFLCSCGSDEQPVVHRPSYNLLLPFVEAAPTLESLTVMALSIEGSVAAAAATCYGDELPDDFIASRDSFYVVVDRKFAGFRKGHFVELRTVLYERAAAVCGAAESKVAVDAIRALSKRCSAALYIDGQRACDPPKKVRERYEEAKETALK